MKEANMKDEEDEDDEDEEEEQPFWLKDFKSKDWQSKSLVLYRHRYRYHSLSFFLPPSTILYQTTC